MVQMNNECFGMILEIKLFEINLIIKISELKMHLFLVSNYFSLFKKNFVKNINNEFLLFYLVFE